MRVARVCAAGKSREMARECWDTLWLNLSAATMAPGGAPYGLVEDAAVGIADGRIAFVGPCATLPGAPETLARRVLDGGGGVMTPGLID